MSTPDSTAFGHTSNQTHGVSESNRSAASWIGRFQVDGLSLVLGAGRSIEDIRVGVSAEELKRLSAIHLLEIQANLGADRREIAQALHRENANEGAVFIDLDVDRVDSFTAVARLVTILTELASSADATTNRAKILGSTVFVDNVQFLCDTSRGCLQRLITKRQKLEAVPRIILGSIAGSDSNLNGMEVFSVAPLHSRPDDVTRFLSRRFEARRNSPSLSEEGLAVLKSWPWTGEEQELSIFADRAQLNHPGEFLSAEIVQSLLSDATTKTDANESLAKVEEDHIYRVLEHHNWNRTKSAKALGIDVKTLYNKLRRYESKRRLESSTSTTS